jgi:type VI secretion system VasI family protein
MNACKSRLPMLAIAGFLGLVPMAASAAPAVERQDIDKCRSTGDRVARLACFDGIFATPTDTGSPAVTLGTPASPAPRSLPGPWQSLAEAQERLRQPGQLDWVSRIRPWQAATYSADPALRTQAQQSDTFDILLTMPELDLAAKPDTARANDRATLLVSCENNITSLMVLLPKAIDGLQANMSLSSDSNTFSRLNWRDVENGGVISAGRGLESIDTLRTLFGRQRIQLQVNYLDGPRAFVFAVADLQEKLKPLRLACHW